MIKFGSKPNPGTIFRASQFLAEELPVRLAHRVKELDELPENLNQMPSIKRVKEWYAQSFDVSPSLVGQPSRSLDDDRRHTSACPLGTRHNAGSSSRSGRFSG